MADNGEEHTRCPVCAETYTTEGYHLLTRLSCEHAVCSTCFQGKLVKKNCVDCPLCSQTHQFVTENVDEIAEQAPREQEEEELCPEHWRKMKLFCFEPGCETHICAKCVKQDQEHRNHDFGNLEEVMGKKFQALLMDVESLKKTLQCNEGKLISVQNKEITKLSTCIDNIRKNEEELIRKINERTQKMVQKLLDRKAQLDNSLNEALVKIKDNSILLESIKDTITYCGSTSYKGFIDKMKAVKKSGEEVSCALTEVQKYKHVAYQDGKISNKKLKMVCGELKTTRRKIPFSKIKAVGRNVMKQRLLSKIVTKRSQRKLREQNRDSDSGAHEESDVEIVEAPESEAEVIEVSDDDESIEFSFSSPEDDVEKKMPVTLDQTQKKKPKVEKDIAIGSSGWKKKARRPHDQKITTSSEYRNVGNVFGARNAASNGSSSKTSTMRLGPQKRSADTSISSTRQGMQSQGPSTKRQRREQTSNEKTLVNPSLKRPPASINKTPAKFKFTRKSNYFSVFV